MAALGGAGTDLDATWDQVAELKPRLASHVEIAEHRYRGDTWYLISDQLTSTHFRCTPAVRDFLVLLDGKHTVAEAFERSITADSEEPVDQVEVLYLLTELQSAQLLSGGVPLDAEALLARQRELKRKRWLRRLASPLAIQVPLLDPDDFLQRGLAWVKPLFSPVFLYLWFILVALTAVAAANQWDALAIHWESRFLDPGNLLLLWLLYPLVKGLHELGHGFATRVWGGEVHEMGVMLLVFTPVPYVDASASSAFASRYQRMVVAAAGIMVELLLTGLALLAWSYSEPGLWRDACFNVMVIGGASTLLFNGNPLLRFDGYYVLADLLEIPNLRSRANQYLGYLLKRHLLHLDRDVAAPASGNERGWLLGYAVLAGIYRLFISFTIALFIAGKYFFIGAALAIWLVFSQIALPLYRIFASLAGQARQQALVGRLWAVTGGGTVLLALALFVVPIGDSTQAEGIVNLPENAQVRTRAPGFVHQIFRQNGESVSAGEPLVELQNLELLAEEAELSARLQELEIRHNRALSGERVEAEILKAEMRSAREELLEIQQQVASLRLLSPHDGVFSLPEAADLPGRFLPKGELLGHVVNRAALTVRVVVPQTSVDRVSRQTRTIEVRLASRLNALLQGGEVQEVPLATAQLPSALFGSSVGGDIAVDARDQEGRLATANIFQLDISLPADAPENYPGQRAYVRFLHHREPLGIGWYRRLRQLLLAEIGV